MAERQAQLPRSGAQLDVDGKEKRSKESNARRLGVSCSALFGGRSRIILVFDPEQRAIQK